MTELAIQFNPEAARFGASHSQKRIEDDRLLTGRGLYSDDRDFPEAAALVLLRSPYAHARVTSCDLDGARSAPGILAVWSIEDLKRDDIGHIPFPPLFKQADGSPMEAPLRTLLADGIVHHVGQAVVAIVAETREQALDAAERVMIEYDELP
jgi:carbon-monoxide dehydrogenase large subunit